MVRNNKRGNYFIERNGPVTTGDLVGLAPKQSSKTPQIEI